MNAVTCAAVLKLAVLSNRHRLRQNGNGDGPIGCVLPPVASQIPSRQLGVVQRCLLDEPKEG